jgi:Spy/CpxP family protein refolding chaperone
MGDPDKMAERMTERMAKAADASPEQTAKLMEISKKAAVDLKPLHEQQRGVRQKIMVLLSSPTLDRAALEQLRVQYMQAMDAISKRRLQSMADGAEVLRPEQRAKLAVHMKERMTRGGAGAGDWTPRR